MVGTQHLAVAQLAKKKVVVDHQHIGQRRLGTGPVRKAGIKMRAAPANAFAVAGGNARQQGRHVVLRAQLGQVTAARAVRPTLYVGQVLLGGQAVVLAAGATGLCQAMQAQIVLSPFQHRHLALQLQVRQQNGNVFVHQLVLQGAGGRTDDKALAALQRRHQVGIGFTGAGGRLNGNGLARLPGRCNSLHHGLLLQAHLQGGEVGVGAGGGHGPTSLAASDGACGLTNGSITHYAPQRLARKHQMQRPPVSHLVTNPKICTMMNPSFICNTYQTP